MTVQTQVRPAGIQVRRPVRGLKAIVLGMTALAAAGAGIGIAVSVSGGERPAVTAPDGPESASLKQMHAENYLNPGSAEQLDALKRHHAEGQLPVPSFSDTFKRFKDDAWSK